VYGVLKTLASRGDTIAPELREQLLQTGVEQGERLRRLLEELLDLSRVDARRIHVDPRPLVVRTILEEIARGAVPAVSPVTIDVAPDLAAIADRHVLDRVVSNLLINALRYGEPPVVVKAEQRDRHLRIAVSDHGSGVPDALRPHLFDRFARGDDTGSAGLGLAISRSYAQAHGGDLIYAPAEGGGARFELILPQSYEGKPS
jgi:two-component system sensor histidine kinase MtrB